MTISYTKKSLTSYAQKIGAAWHRAAESIIEVGCMLNEAEDKLGPPGFRELRKQLQNDKVMSGATISKLKIIAQNALLTAPKRVQLLPPSYETLYNLSRWDDANLEQGFSDGTISPEMQQHESRLKEVTVTDETKEAMVALFSVQYRGDELKPGSKRKLRSIIKELNGMKDITVKTKMDI